MTSGRIMPIQFLSCTTRTAGGGSEDVPSGFETGSYHVWRVLGVIEMEIAISYGWSVCQTELKHANAVFVTGVSARVCSFFPHLPHSSQPCLTSSTRFMHSVFLFALPPSASSLKSSPYVKKLSAPCSRLQLTSLQLCRPFKLSKLAAACHLVLRTPTTTPTTRQTAPATSGTNISATSKN